MKREIQRIFIGLPDEFKNRVHWVDKNYRKNPLSLEPGGSDVVIEFKNNHVFGYDCVKFPSNYIYKIILRIIEEEEINDFMELPLQIQFDIVKQKIHRVYARKYIDKEEYLVQPFVEVWNANTSNELPWVVLKEYDFILWGNSKKQYVTESVMIISINYDYNANEQQQSAKEYSYNYLNHNTVELIIKKSTKSYQEKIIISTESILGELTPPCKGEILYEVRVRENSLLISPVAVSVTERIKLTNHVRPSLKNDDHTFIYSRLLFKKNALFHVGGIEVRDENGLLVTHPDRIELIVQNTESNRIERYFVKKKMITGELVPNAEVLLFKHNSIEPHEKEYVISAIAVQPKVLEKY